MQTIELIQGLCNPNNVIRKQSEDYYNQLKNVDNIKLVSDLIIILSNVSNDVNIRSLCAILLRREISLLTQTLEHNILAELRLNLLNIWTAETNFSIIKLLNHVLAQSISIKDWNDLIPTILGYKNQNLSDFLILSKLNFIEVLSEYFSLSLITHINIIIIFLDQHLSSSNISIQIGCARAVLSVIVVIEDDKIRNQFKGVLLPIITILNNSLNINDESNGVVIIEHLISIAEIQPKIFKGLLDQIIEAMLIVVKAENLEFSTRSTALELIVTITETMPTQAKKCLKLLDGLIPLAFSLMLELEDNENEWIKEKYVEEVIDESYVIGEEAIERVTTALGGKLIASSLLQYVQSFIQSNDYRHRRAAIAGLLRFAEGSVDIFQNYFNNETIKLLENCIEDKSVRVRYEVVQAIGRLSAILPDQIPIIINKFIHKLINILQDLNQCDRLRGHVASAMINIFNPENNSDNYNIDTYIQDLLNAIVITLQSSNIEVKIPTIVLLGCLAQCSKSSFISFYPNLINGVKSILYTTANHNGSVYGNDVDTYQGKAIECIGLMSTAVGIEIFKNDANEIMNFIMHIISRDPTSDIIFEYYLPATARISKIYKDNFCNYLPIIMKLLTDAINENVDVSMVDAEEDDVEGEVIVDEDTGNESTVIKLGKGVKKRLTMNTHVIQRKLQATRLVYEFVQNLSSSMFSYLSDCLKVLTHLLPNKYLADIRSTAVLGLQQIFSAYVDSYNKHIISSTDLIQVCNYILTSIHNQYSNETDTSTIIESINEIFVLCYQSGTETTDCKYINQICLPDYNLVTSITNSIYNDFKLVLSNYINTYINSTTRNEDDDSIQDNEESDNIISTLRNMIDLFGNVIKLYPSQAIPFIDNNVLPLLSNYLQKITNYSNSHITDLQIISICLIDDIIEYGNIQQSMLYSYISNIIDLLTYNIHSINSTNLLIQCSSYGVVQLLKGLPDICLPYIPVILPIFVQLVSRSTAYDDDNIGITDNITCGIGIIINTSNLLLSISNNDLPIITKLWLKGLPIKSDENSGKFSHFLLFHIIDSYIENSNSDRTTNLFIRLPNFLDENLDEIIRIIIEIIIYTNNIINNNDNYDIIYQININYINIIINKIIIYITNKCNNNFNDIINNIINKLTLQQKNIFIQYANIH